MIQQQSVGLQVKATPPKQLYRNSRLRRTWKEVCKKAALLKSVPLNVFSSRLKNLLAETIHSFLFVVLLGIAMHVVYRRKQIHAPLTAQHMLWIEALGRKMHVHSGNYDIGKPLPK